MAGKLLGWEKNLVLSSYGESFRNQRRVLHRHLGSRNQLYKIEPWHEMIESEAHTFLKRALVSPGALSEHLHKYVTFLSKYNVRSDLLQDEWPNGAEHGLWLQIEGGQGPDGCARQPSSCWLCARLYPWELPGRFDTSL
jgi:hypothetical protein